MVELAHETRQGPNIGDWERVTCGGRDSSLDTLPAIVEEFVCVDPNFFVEGSFFVGKERSSLFGTDDFSENLVLHSFAGQSTNIVGRRFIVPRIDANEALTYSRGHGGSPSWSSGY